MSKLNGKKADKWAEARRIYREIERADKTLSDKGLERKEYEALQNRVDRLASALGLEPASSPLEVIRFPGAWRVSVYVKVDGTDQLRALHGVSAEIKSQSVDPANELAIVVARCTIDETGRSAENVGATSLTEPLYEYPQGSKKRRVRDDDGNPVSRPIADTARANLVMKAATKAIRRATLALLGLGFLEEASEEDVAGESDLGADSSDEAATESDQEIVEEIQNALGNCQTLSEFDKVLEDVRPKFKEIRSREAQARLAEWKDDRRKSMASTAAGKGRQ